jgi:uncharacterized membrane protein
MPYPEIKTIHEALEALEVRDRTIAALKAELAQAKAAPAPAPAPAPARREATPAPAPAARLTPLERITRAVRA